MEIKFRDLINLESLILKIPFLIFLSLVIILFILNPFNSEKEDATFLEELKVITKISPNTYIESDDGPNGFEYALLEKFSKYIGKELKLSQPIH